MFRFTLVQTKTEWLKHEARQYGLKRAASKMQFTEQRRDR